MTTTSNDITTYVGQTVTDPKGEKIGKVSQVYVDEQSGQPAFATIRTGLFGSASSFVPLQGLQPSSKGLVSAWDKEKVKGAPRVEDDGDGYLTPDEEQALFRWYSMTDEPQVIPDAAPPAAGTTAAPTGEGTAMTRSEEELWVGKTTAETGRVRLRKHVVAEDVRKEQIVPEGDGTSR